MPHGLIFFKGPFVRVRRFIFGGAYVRNFTVFKKKVVNKNYQIICMYGVTLKSGEMEDSI